MSTTEAPAATAASATGLTMDTVKRYAALANEKTQLDDRLKAIEREMKALNDQVLEWFASNSVDKVKLEGRTLYLRRELWATRPEGVTLEQQIAALQAAGLADMCAPRINSQTLSAFCREREAAGEPLPPSFAGVIEAKPTFKIGSTRS